MNEIPADFTATARGVVKIPGGCKCSVSCTGGFDYAITCSCKFDMVPDGRPSILTSQELDAADKVADPRSVWNWVDTRHHYGPREYNVNDSTWIID